MEEQTLTPITTRSRVSKIKPLLFTVLVIILIFAAGAGVYFWQHNKVSTLNSQIQSLRTQGTSKATNQSSNSSKSTASPSTFIYRPKTGGLSLILPTTYGVIVSVDGNAGGAPGATFRIASATNANEFSDAAYQGVQVDIGNTFKDLSSAVQSEESKLDNQRGAGSVVNRNYKVSDTTVAGLPAKLLTADGLDEYQGNIAVYLVGSGSFLYMITANGTQNTSFPLLEAVLKGVSIKPVIL